MLARRPEKRDTKKLICERCLFRTEKTTWSTGRLKSPGGTCGESPGIVTAPAIARVV